MNRVGETMPTEYSDRFDELRQNRVEVGYYKYEPAKVNYKYGMIKALESAKLCIDKYIKTGNTEYLCDAANYLMFEFMYPQKPGSYISRSCWNTSWTGTLFAEITVSKKNKRKGPDYRAFSFLLLCQ